jgi:hypothetical protein
MSRSHTPAPWHNGWGKIVDSEGKAICMVTYRKNGYNDLLLAAAPDLLVALRDLLEDAVALGICESNMSGSAVAARAAIAKATGGAA